MFPLWNIRWILDTGDWVLYQHRASRIEHRASRGVRLIIVAIGWDRGEENKGR
ncbi:MAG: hypothetical protein AB1797_08970 [bacterium]